VLADIARERGFTVLKFQDSEPLSPIKEFLGEDYTYGEIKAVMATM
jgi:hypothetical protein